MCVNLLTLKCSLIQSRTKVNGFAGIQCSNYEWGDKSEYHDTARNHIGRVQSRNCPLLCKILTEDLTWLLRLIPLVRSHILYWKHPRIYCSKDFLLRNGSQGLWSAGVLLLCAMLPWRIKAVYIQRASYWAWYVFFSISIDVAWSRSIHMWIQYLHQYRPRPDNSPVSFSRWLIGIAQTKCLYGCSTFVSSIRSDLNLSLLTLIHRYLRKRLGYLQWSSCLCIWHCFWRRRAFRMAMVARSKNHSSYWIHAELIPGCFSLRVLRPSFSVLPSGSCSQTVCSHSCTFYTYTSC